MMKTPYDAARQEQSNRAHELACQIFYPAFFGRPCRVWEPHDQTGRDVARLLDLHMGVDRVFKVDVAGFRAPIRHFVQERFREPKYARYEDITITEYNTRSGKLSEQYKMVAGYFVYGYHNEDFSDFLDIVALDVAEFNRAIHYFDAPAEENEKGQVFRTYRFDELEREGLLIRPEPWASRRRRSKKPVRFGEEKTIRLKIA